MRAQIFERGHGWERKVFRPCSASLLNHSVESAVCVLAATLRKQPGNSFGSEGIAKVVKVIRCKNTLFRVPRLYKRTQLDFVNSILEVGATELLLHNDCTHVGQEQLLRTALCLDHRASPLQYSRGVKRRDNQPPSVK